MSITSLPIDLLTYLSSFLSIRTRLRCFSVVSKRFRVASMRSVVSWPEFDHGAFKDDNDFVCNQRGNCWALFPCLTSVDLSCIDSLPILLPPSVRSLTLAYPANSKFIEQGSFVALTSLTVKVAQVDDHLAQFITNCSTTLSSFSLLLRDEPDHHNMITNLFATHFPRLTAFRFTAPRSEWEERLITGGPRSYFYNDRTKTTSWEHPARMDFVETLTPLLTNHAAQLTTLSLRTLPVQELLTSVVTFPAITDLDLEHIENPITSSSLVLLLAQFPSLRSLALYADTSVLGPISGTGSGQFMTPGTELITSLRVIALANVTVAELSPAPFARLAHFSIAENSDVLLRFAYGLTSLISLELDQAVAQSPIVRRNYNELTKLSPKLRYLAIHSSPSSTASPSPLLSVTSLDLSTTAHWERDSYALLNAWFPNLEHLSLPANDSYDEIIPAISSRGKLKSVIMRSKTWRLVSHYNDPTHVINAKASTSALDRLKTLFRSRSSGVKLTAKQGL